MLKYFRLALIALIGLALAGVASAAPMKHGPVSHAVANTVKFVVTSPAHPVSRLKQIAGVILTVPEPVLDGGVYVGEALDKFASLELKHNPFHYVYLGIDKVHDLDEKAQDFLFGSHN